MNKEQELLQQCKDAGLTVEETRALFLRTIPQNIVRPLSYAEITKEMGFKTRSKTVHTIHRALKKIMKYVGEESE